MSASWSSAGPPEHGGPATGPFPAGGISTCRHVYRRLVTGPRPTQLGGVGAMLSPTTWRELLELGRARRYEQGAVLMRQGDQGDVVLALIRGRVKVFRSEPDGLELPLAVRYPGELLGEIAVVG